jgi:hypothetical protein
MRAHRLPLLALPLLALPLVLSACGGLGGFVPGGAARAPGPQIAGSNAPEDNPFPVNYKPEILAFLRTYLNDPTNVHDAFITEPVMKTFGDKKRYVVCVSYNAKKTTGEYGGSKDRMAVFYVGRFNEFLENGREQCAGDKFQPFPELEHLTR